MPISSISDLSQSLLLRRDNAKLRQELLSASRELATGRRDNLVSDLGSTMSQLADIEGGLRRTESFLFNIADQRVLSATAQSAINSIRDSIGEVSSSLILVRDTADSGLVRTAGRDALGRFDGVIANLNVSAGGISVFSGIESDMPALVSGDAILGELENEILLAGATTADDVRVVVETWFDTAGGFAPFAYTGGAQSVSAVPISGSLGADPMTTAEDPAFRDTLSALAMAALIGRDILTAAPDEQARLARIAGLELLGADESLVELQAAIGTQENRLARAEAEVRAQAEALEMARTDLAGVDPFDAATRLQATEGQLESLYTMTARLSRLSLTDFLR